MLYISTGLILCIMWYDVWKFVVYIIIIDFHRMENDFNNYWSMSKEYSNYLTIKFPKAKEIETMTKKLQ